MRCSARGRGRSRRRSPAGSGSTRSTPAHSWPSSPLADPDLIWKLIALVVPLGLDTLAVSAALGLRGRPRLRTSLVLAGFEVAMPLVGLALGRAVGATVGAAADWVAIALVAGAGAWMLLERGEVDDATTLALGLSVSLDELAIGSALGLLGVPVWFAVALIGAQAFAFAQLGLRLGARVGEGAERLAGVVLLVLAGVLLVEQVL